MSLFIGPHHGRWTPGSWDDVVRAAGGGLLDETQWVELKEMLPAGNRITNLELGRDLASLAVEGGLLVVGVQPDGIKAGPVVGSPLVGIEDRIDQVARDRVTPPLVVRTVALPKPGEDTVGCVLVIVDASADAPHMVDDTYWGRGSTGKRALTDTEVRRLLQERLAHRQEFTHTFRNLRNSSPVDSPGTIHLLLAPRAGRSDLAAGLVDRRSHLQQFCITAADARPYNWRLDNMTVARRRFSSIELTNHPPVFGADGDSGDKTSITDINAEVMSLSQNGTLFFSCTRLVYEAETHRGKHRELSTDGVIELTQQVVAVAGAVARAAGYAGTWDVGVALDGLHGARPAPAHGQPVGTYGTTFADHQYTAITTVGTTQLVDQPASVVAGFLRPMLAVVGAENRVPST